ncbi:unnamed protein product [Camellia sinensis]
MAALFPATNATLSLSLSIPYGWALDFPKTMAVSLNSVVPFNAPNWSHWNGDWSWKLHGDDWINKVCRRVRLSSKTIEEITRKDLVIKLIVFIIFGSSDVSYKRRANYLHAPRSGIGASLLKASHFTSPSGIVSLRTAKGKKWGVLLLVANGDDVATDISDKGSENAERSDSDDRSSAVTLPSLDSPIRNSQFQTSTETESGPQISEDVNGSVISKNASSVSLKSGLKRSPLTAREKLRAARVLSRYTESKASKASKSELGSNVLEALRESDRGKKKSRLPEAPTNLFDDSKRGMPKPGLTFEFPGGFDAFIILVSFVTISSLMFATTYIVWKVGAIHFNEY